MNRVLKSVWKAVYCPCLLVACGAGSLTFAQDAQPGRTVAATVDGFEITTEAARRQLETTLPNLKKTDRLSKLLAATIDQLIDRRIVYQSLVAGGKGAGKNEVQVELEAFKAKLSRYDKTPEQHLEENSQTMEEFKFELAWQIAWRRYLKEKLTDEYLQAWFQQHQRVFDGTKLRVAHLLIKTDGEHESVQTATLQAEKIFAQLSQQQIDWATAVKEHSQAPTRETAGEMGWIACDRPMPASFSTAAFKLNPGEISQPVVTSFGVHLIKCLEVRDGKTGWQDAKHEVRQHAAKALFQNTANQYREQVTIKRYIQRY